MGRDQAGDLAFFNHNEAPPPAAKQFMVHKVLEIQPGIHRGAIPGHDVRDQHAIERVLKFHADIAISRGLQEKPADKCDPQTSDAGPAEVADNAERDKREAYHLSRPPSSG